MKYILIVEDDTALREGLITALQSDSLTVHAAADLAEAHRILRERTFDLLLLDVNLPDGSGIELCREVTAVQDVPVIFLTVREADDDTEATGDSMPMSQSNLPAGEETEVVWNQEGEIVDERIRNDIPG